jgi:hypothetical protein
MEPQVPRFEIAPGGNVRRLAELVARDLDVEGCVVVHGRGGAPVRAAFTVCQLAAPVEAYDASGTTRPHHPIIKQTDRGDVTNTNSTDVPFELVLSRVTNYYLPAGAAYGVRDEGVARRYLFV